MTYEPSGRFYHENSKYITVPCKKTRLFPDTIWKTCCSSDHRQGTKMFYTSFESPKSDLKFPVPKLSKSLRLLGF